MSTPEEEITKLFRVRRTLIQMLNDRGYMVEDSDMEMTRQRFVEKFGESMKRDELVINKARRDNSSDRIFVFFLEEPKVSVKAIKIVVGRMQSEKVFRAIVVFQQHLTPVAKKCLQEMPAKFRIEVFQESELLVNIRDHDLIPEHQPLSPTEGKAVLERYSLNVTQLPRIQFNDPVARYYGLQRNQIVRIIRSSETAGRYVTYRCVV